MTPSSPDDNKETLLQFPTSQPCLLGLQAQTVPWVRIFSLQHLELTYLYCPNTDTDIESMLSNFVGQSMPFSESVSPSVESDS